MNAEETAQEATPIIPAPDEAPALPAPNESIVLSSQADTARENAAREAEQPAPARKGSCFLRAVLIVGLLVVIGGALVAAIYFGWPLVYQRYVLPVQNNIDRVAVLEKSQQDGQEQLSALQTQLPVMAASQAELAATLTALAPRISTLESSAKAQDQALAASKVDQAAAIAALGPRIKTLESSIDAHAQALAGLQSTQSSLQAASGGQQAELDRQITLMKSMELLSRARLFLYQSNFGLAKQDVQGARDLLAKMPGSSDKTLDKSMAEVVQHLELALSRLPDFPVAASDDLDIAWQILLNGPSQQTSTPAPAAAQEEAPTATPETPTQTEMPGLTPTPTAAP